MIEPKKRAADMAVVPAAVKRPRTELVSAAQSQQLVATVSSLTCGNNPHISVNSCMFSAARCTQVGQKVFKVLKQDQQS